MRKAKKENLLGYEIKIIPDGESGYFAVRFPDFPSVITGDIVLRKHSKMVRKLLN
jgi:hypothetical protein